VLLVGVGEIVVAEKVPPLAIAAAGALFLAAAFAEAEVERTAVKDA